jgi:hypothetical protein
MRGVIVEKLDLIYDAVVRVDERTQKLETTVSDLIVDVTKIKEREKPNTKLLLALGGLLAALIARSFV